MGDGQIKAAHGVHSTLSLMPTANQGSTDDDGNKPPYGETMVQFSEKVDVCMYTVPFSRRSNSLRLFMCSAPSCPLRTPVTHDDQPRIATHPQKKQKSRWCTKKRFPLYVVGFFVSMLLCGKLYLVNTLQQYVEEGRCEIYTTPRI